MTASELIYHSLNAGCSVVRYHKSFEFTCPTSGTPCSSCGMWNIPNLTDKCLFWDEDLVPNSLQHEAISILQTTRPELFI